MNTDKKEIQKRIGALTHQKYEIEQELLTLQKEYSEIFKAECEQYIGKCYKQSVEDDDGDIKETYYKDLVDMNNKVPAKEVECLDLKCPNCDSTGPFTQEYMYSSSLYRPPVWLDGSTINTNPSHDIKTIEYTCEKCGCKFKVKFQGTEIVNIQEI